MQAFKVLGNKNMRSPIRFLITLLIFHFFCNADITANTDSTNDYPQPKTEVEKNKDLFNFAFAVIGKGLYVKTDQDISRDLSFYNVRLLLNAVPDKLFFSIGIQGSTTVGKGYPAKLLPEIEKSIRDDMRVTQRAFSFLWTIHFKLFKDLFIFADVPILGGSSTTIESNSFNCPQDIAEGTNKCTQKNNYNPYVKFNKLVRSHFSLGLEYFVLDKIALESKLMFMDYPKFTGEKDNVGSEHYSEKYLVVAVGYKF
jgi:hypothetical protein